MKTLILVLLNCLLLWSTISYGNGAPELPPLPNTEMSDSAKSSGEDKSFWHKILDWVGLGEKESTTKTTKISEAKASAEKTVVTSTIAPEAPSQSKVPDLPPPPTPVNPQEQSQIASSSVTHINPVVNITVTSTPLVVQSKPLPSLPKQDSNTVDSPNSSVIDSSEKNITPISSVPISTPAQEPITDTSTPVTDLKLPEGFDIDKDDDSNTLPPKDKAAVDKTSVATKQPNQPIQALSLPSVEPAKETTTDVKHAETKTEVTDVKAVDVPNLNTTNDNAPNPALAVPNLDIPPPPPPSADVTPPAPSSKDTKEGNTTESKEKTPITPNLSESENEGPTGNTKSQVMKFRKQLQERLNQTESLPQIPANQVASSKNKSNNSESENSPIDDTTQLKFVIDEAQVLQLPNDDVVLGEVTPEARLDLIDFSSYVPMFWANYNTLKEEPARQEIDNFIKTYDSNPIKPSHPEIEKALGDAFHAIDAQVIYDLISLLETYPILQLTDQEGNNLLHRAAQSNNYLAAKFLLMKGINWSAQNHSGQTPMDIVLQNNDPRMIKLFQSAGIR